MSKNKSPFEIQVEKNGFKLYTFMPYYPLNRYSDSDLTLNESRFRKLVWNFKDGLLSKEFGELVASSLKSIYTDAIIRRYIFCIIPASTQFKTERRFKSFCKVVSEKAKIINGYDYIQNSFDHDAGHVSVTKPDILEFVNVSDSFNSRDVILFDDVTTRGSTFLSLARKLTVMGAASVTGIFLGKTTYKDSASSLDEILDSFSE